MEYLIIVLATVAVWGHTARFDFTWDDRQFIVENQSIRSWGHLPEMLNRRDGQSSLPEDFCLYRPVRTVAYALFARMGGGPLPKPWVYHVANLAGHAFAAMLFCAVAGTLLRRFGGVSPNASRIAGLLLGLGFAVHPVVSEVVCWAKSFDDVLTAIFCLAAFAQLLAWSEEHPGRLWAAMAFFALAVYSKESAVPFALVALAYFWFLLKEPFRRSLKLSSGFFAIAAFYILHRHLVLGQTSQTAPLSGSYWQTLVDTIPCVLTYARLGLGIPPFTIVYAHLQHGRGLFSAAVALGMLFLLLSAAVMTATLRSERWKLAGFGLFWAASFFIPVSNIVPMMQFMAERFMYLPLLGILLAAGLLLIRVPRGRLVAIATCAGVTMWAVVAWDRSWVWSDDLTLFVQTAMSNPRNHVIEKNAADAILNLPAVTRVTRAAKTAPPSPIEVQSAIRTLSTARRAFPANGQIANALGVSWISDGNLEEAVTCFRGAVSAMPQSERFCLNLGNALIQSGRTPEANRVLRQLLPFHENDISFLRMFCGVLLAQKEFEEANPLIAHLKQLDPASPEYDRWLGQAGTQPGKKNEAGGRP